jgi:hypothetical protein
MKSPYLDNEHRLADILAAIQVMGSHLWDSRNTEDWKRHLGEKPQSALSWEALFAEHPEFFGQADWGGKTLHFLRLRRAYERTIDPNSLRELTDSEIEALKDKNEYDKARLARRTLTPEQVEALMNAAIELQVRAGALADRKRWWLPALTAGLGFLGALAGSLVKLL